MKVFVTSSFGDSKQEVEAFCIIVRSAGFDDFSFIRDVENFEKVFDDPKDLMKRTKEEIEKCDALLIDMTDKPTGRAYEAGMAYAFGKPVIAVMKAGTAIKDTTRGLADVLLEYNQLNDLVESLSEVRTKWERDE